MKQLIEDFKRDKNNIWVFCLRVMLILPFALLSILGEKLEKYAEVVCDFLDKKLPRRRL